MYLLNYIKLLTYIFFSFLVSCQLSSNLNGGGYSGLTSSDDGIYNSDFILPNSNNELYYARYAVQNTCLSDISLNGIIKLSDNGISFAQTRCDSFNSILFNDLNIIDYNTNIIIYQNKIYEKNDNFSTISNIEQSVILCRNFNTDPVSGFDSGIDLVIHTINENITGTIIQGKKIDSQYKKFKVEPFTLIRNIQDNIITFSNISSNIYINFDSNSSFPKTGHLKTNINQENVELDVTCYSSLE